MIPKIEKSKDFIVAKEKEMIPKKGKSKNKSALKHKTHGTKKWLRRTPRK